MDMRLWRKEASPVPVTQPATPSPSPEPVLEESLGRLDEPPEPTPATPKPAYVPLPSVAPDSEPLGGTLTVALTFYVCTNAPPGQSYCGTMSSGTTVYEGAAACGEALSLGTQFSIVGEGRTYTCEDRGRGGAYWIDIFHYDYYAGRAWRDDWPQSVEIQVLP